MLNNWVKISLLNFQSTNVVRFINATLAYLVTAVALFVIFQWLRYQVPAAVLQDILSFFFISAVASGIEPGTAKAYLLMQNTNVGKSNIGLLSLLLVSTIKAFLASPFFAVVWFLTNSGDASNFWYIAWTPILIIIGFITTDLRVIIDAGERYTHAVWLKQGSLSLGMLVLASAYMAGMSLDIAIGAALLSRLLWLMAFLLMEHHHFGRTATSIIEPLVSVEQRRWLDLALTSVLAAISGSIDRILVFMYLPAAEASSFFIISELLTKFWLLPYVLGPIVFAKWATGADGSSFTRGAHVIIVTAGVTFVTIVAFAVYLYPHYIRIILGEAFDVYGIVLFSMAIVIVSTSQIYLAELQGRGRAKQVVNVFLFITILSVPLFYFCIQVFSLQGLYSAWVIKATIECAFLYYIVTRTMHYEPSR